MKQVMTAQRRTSGDTGIGEVFLNNRVGHTSYMILTETYDASVSSSLITLRDNDSDTRGHNLKKMQTKYQERNSSVHGWTDVWNSISQPVVETPFNQSFWGCGGE